MTRRPDPEAAIAAYNRRNRPRPGPAMLGRMRADVETAEPLKLVERDEPEWRLSALGPHNAVAESYTLGGCTVLVTREFGEWHLSIAHPSRDPTWGEISQAWYRIVGPRLPAGRVGALILPRLDTYVNIHRHCFHVHEVPDGDGPGT